MISYIPINGELNIVHQEIKVKKTVTKKEPCNHIWIYDRSGSMWGLLDQLTKQMIDLSKKLPKNDTLSLGWFSSEGDFEFILKGFKITDKSDYTMLEKVIKANSTTRGCTCFSEILSDTKNVIKELSSESKVFSLSFFTDGYPVVSNYKREFENIFQAIQNIKGSISTAMFVGYGSYYNKELMSQMAEKLGAMLIHSSMISEYANSITKLVKLSESQEPKEEIDPPVKNPLAIFSVTDQGVIIYSIDPDGKLYVNPQSGKSTNIFYITKETPNKKSWDKVEIDSIDFADKNNIISKAMYASALVLTQQVKTDVALEIIGKIGDKKMVDAVTNAFTIDEYGIVESDLNNCIEDISARFVTGRDKNYLPPTDAFCAFDLLNVLMEDETASFYPYHKDFTYERIGVPSKVADGYPKFQADEKAKCPFNTLVWHSSRLNLNVQTKINGTIELFSVEGKKPANYGFADIYPVYVFRNYTFIKDGRIHVKKFYVSTSEKTYMTLKNKGVVVDDTFSTDGIYGLDISRLPVINRAIATGKTSATELCKAVYTEQCLKAKIKSLKYLKKQECGEDKITSTTFSEEQIKFLTANGVDVEKGGLFAPPVEKEEAKDKYMAKSFEIKIAGLSSLPTVKKVQEKIENGKTRTPVESLLEEGIKIFEKSKSTLINEDIKKAWFKTTLEDLNKQLKEVRTKIQETKFAVIMGKSWFEEFSSRNQTEIVVDGNKFNFVLKEEEVEI